MGDVSRVVKLTYEKNDLIVGKVSSLSSNKMSDAVWAYAGRPKLARPERMHIVKITLCDHDFKKIALQLRFVIREFERNEVFLYDFDITQDFHGALCPQDLLSNLMESGEIMVRSHPVKTAVGAADETLRIVRANPHVAVQWYSKALRCWVGWVGCFTKTSSNSGRVPAFGRV